MNLDEWLDRTAWDKIYWAEIKQQAISDGCTDAPDWYIWTCWEHDYHYDHHKMIDGTEIDRATADYILRVRIQQGSGWGSLSVLSWAYWLGVRLGGGKHW